MTRCEWPKDVSRARAGGFVVQELPDGTIVYRNPATQHILELMENILALTRSVKVKSRDPVALFSANHIWVFKLCCVYRTLHQIWLPEILQCRHSDFEKAFDLLEVEKQMTLGRKIFMFYLLEKYGPLFVHRWPMCFIQFLCELNLTSTTRGWHIPFQNNSEQHQNAVHNL